MEGDLDKSLLRDVQTSVFRIAGGYLQHSPPVYCIFIRSHILTFQWIVPGSMGWTEKKFNKHESLIFAWKMTTFTWRRTTYNFDLKTGNENAKNHAFFRAQNHLLFCIASAFSRIIYLFIYSARTSRPTILCHVYSKRFLRHDLCQRKKTEKKFRLPPAPTAPIKRNRTK